MPFVHDRGAALREALHVRRRDRQIDDKTQTRFDPPMCNLYSITRSQDAMRRLFRVGRDLTGNLPLLPTFFRGMEPEQAARNDMAPAAVEDEYESADDAQTTPVAPRRDGAETPRRGR